MTKATLSNLKEIKETRMFELGSTTFLVVNLGEQGHVAGQAYVSFLDQMEKCYTLSYFSHKFAFFALWVSYWNLHPYEVAKP